MAFSTDFSTGFSTAEHFPGKKCLRLFCTLPNKKGHPRRGIPCFGAGDRTRTGTSVTSRDFKSLVSTYSTTTANISILLIFVGHPANRILSPWCLPVAVPCVRLGANAGVAHRPLPTLRPRYICHRQRSGSWPIPPQRQIWFSVTTSVTENIVSHFSGTVNRKNNACAPFHQSSPAVAPHHHKNACRLLPPEAPDHGNPTKHSGTASLRFAL